MKQVEYAATGTMISGLCLGTMMFGDRCDQAESDRILTSAIDQGVTFVDTAAMYCDGETEAILGRILGARRNDLFLGTKVHKTTEGAWIRQSMDESLQRLQTDYVDLLMIHWPHTGMEIPGMMEALNDVVVQGKARYVGCCNFPAWLLAHCNAVAQENGWAKLTCNQIPYNPIERGVEVEVLPQAVAERIAVTVYRPLLMGVLAGKYQPGQPIPEDSRGYTDARVADWLDRFGSGIVAFNEMAAARGLHPAQLAVAWICKSPGVTSPISGVSSLGQLQASIDAMAVDLTDGEYAAIAAMFDSAVQEESGGNYANLRRATDLVAMEER